MENEITGLYAIPYDTEAEVGATKAFPLGRWVHQQRKALRAGELEPHRKELLDAPEAGMVWEPGEEAWENKLAALRYFRRATGHLAPRRMPSGTIRPAAALCLSGSTWPTSGARMVSGRTRGGPPYARRSSPRSTRSGTVPAPWTDSATAACSPTWSTPTGYCPTWSLGC